MISKSVISQKNEIIKNTELVNSNNNLNSKEERWRFSPIKEFIKSDFSGKNNLNKKSIDIHKFDEAIEIFIKGGSIHELGNLPSGIEIIQCENDLKKIYQFLPNFGNIINSEDYYFSDENTIEFSNCIILIINENKFFEKPIHLIHNQSKHKDFTRIFIHCKNNSELKIIESYNNSIQNSYQNSVVEILMEQESKLDFYCIQNGNESNWLFYNLGVKLFRNSQFKKSIFSLSSYRIINELFCDLNEDGAEAEISGLYLADKDSHRDNHVKIIHSAPNTYSFEIFKGILCGRSSGVFNGIIIVKQDAQKINSNQTNRNLLLSSDAQMNSNPQLEIYADDVKCSHGSTAGQIDDDALFYMRSRGISEGSAIKMLVKGFADEILDKVKIKSMLDFLEPKIEDLVDKN